MSYSHPGRHAQTGLTLVELMVALLLQGILLIIIVQLYVSGNQLFRYQTEVGSLDSRGRFSTGLLTSDLRSSGFTGCRSLYELEPRVIANDFDGFEPDTMVEVFDGGGGWTPPAGYSHTSGTDVLVVRYAGEGGYLVGNTTPSNANIQVNRNPGELESDDLVLVTDCESADIFRATNVSEGASRVTIAHANSSNTTNRLSKNYRQNSLVFAFRETAWFVGSDGTDQGLYRMRDNSDPVLIAREVPDFSVEITEDEQNEPVGARFGLLLASDDHIATEPMTVTFDGTTYNGGGGDRRIRKAYWTYANLRNNVP